MFRELLVLAGTIAAGMSLSAWRSVRRRRAAVVLQQRARFARALDHARDAMLLVGTDGRVLDVNDETLRLSGYPRAELIGRHIIDDLCAPKQREDARAAWLRMTGPSPEALFETEAYSANGRAMPVEVSGRVALVEDQRTVVLVIRDITERRAARERERRLQRILRTTSEINQLIVRESDARRLVDRACQILVEHGGFQLAWIGLPGTDGYFDIVACHGVPDHADGLKVRWDDSPEGSGPAGQAFRVRQTRVVPVGSAAFAPWRERARASGFVVGAGTPLLAGDGCRGVLVLYSSEREAFTPDIVALVGELGNDLGFALSTIEHRAALREAQAAAARSAAALSQAAEAMILTNAEGVIVDVNPAFERITGYARAEVIGRNPSLLKSGRQSPAFYRDMWGRLTRGEVFSGELTNRRKDGRLYVAEVVLSAVRDTSGAIVNYVALQRDVTRERLLSEQLRRVQRVEELGQLSGGMAHDFNNLLTIILSNLSLLEADLPAEAHGIRPYLADIGDAARRGSEMVRKLLAVGRQKKLNMELVDAGGLVGDFQRMLRRVIPESVEQHCIVDGPLPAIYADAGSLEQMLLNLATNARDAMPSGGTLTVRASRRLVDDAEAQAQDAEPGEYVVISAEDTGTGMDEATVARVFEPFFTTKEVGKGTGLGLAMVFGLMRQHQGFVRIQSTPGAGTAVQLHFPARGDLARPAVAAAASTRAAGGSETILVVEDEPALRAAATRCLTRKGYRVIEAAHGEEGWEQFRQHGEAIALVLSDAVMPRLSGPALLARIRAAGSAVPFVLSSGYAEMVMGEAGDQRDAALLPKPWSMEDLARAVRGQLDEHLHPSGR